MIPVNHLHVIDNIATGLFMEVLNKADEYVKANPHYWFEGIRITVCDYLNSEIYINLVFKHKEYESLRSVMERRFDLKAKTQCA